jgi:hypothetical protein
LEILKGRITGIVGLAEGSPQPMDPSTGVHMGTLPATAPPTSRGICERLRSIFLGIVDANSLRPAVRTGSIANSISGCTGILKQLSGHKKSEGLS